MYGGGVAGGKTIITLGLLDELCQQYPGVRFVVVRKSLTTIRRNTIPSFTKILKMNGDINRARLHKGEWTYFYTNGSEILFMEADISNDPELNKLRGLEITGAVMEEANECSEKAFNILITRIGRWYNKEHNLPPFILLSCNPDSNWVKDKFYDPWAREELNAPYYFKQALPHDNPHNPEEYLQGLEDLPEAEYERYVKGNWDYAGDPNQLIQFMWYKEQVYEEKPDMSEAKYIGVDVAREGNDMSTFSYFSDNKLLKIERYKFDTCNPLAEILHERMLELNIPGYNVMVDAIGLGASLIDLMIEKDVFVEIFKSSHSPADIDEVGLTHFLFKNKRGQAHWLYRESIKDRTLLIPNDYELQRQTMVLRYLVEEKYIIIESKKIMKKRLGYSPDTAESVIIGNYLRVIRASGTILVDFDVNSTGTMARETIISMEPLDDRERTNTAKELVY